MISLLGYTINSDIASRIAFPIILVIATIVIAKVFNKILIKIFDRNQRLGNLDKTKLIFLRRFSVVLIYVLGFVIAMLQVPSLRSLSLSLFAGAGILAAIVGFASQKAFSNLISGFFIATYEPFRVGDKIRINNYFGTVTDINLRHTMIRTEDHKFIIVPNSIMGESEIENYSIEDLRVLNLVDIPVSYDADIEKARKIIEEEARKHKDFLDYKYEHDYLKAQEKVKVRLTEFKESALNLRLYVWTEDYATGVKMKADLNEKIRDRFNQEGIEIPYPYRTIVYKNQQKASLR